MQTSFFSLLFTLNVVIVTLMLHNIILKLLVFKRFGYLDRYKISMTMIMTSWITDEICSIFLCCKTSCLQFLLLVNLLGLFNTIWVTYHFVSQAGFPSAVNQMSHMQELACAENVAYGTDCFSLFNLSYICILCDCAQNISGFIMASVAVCNNIQKKWAITNVCDILHVIWCGGKFPHGKIFMSKTFVDVNFLDAIVLRKFLLTTKVVRLLLTKNVFMYLSFCELWHP